MKLRHSEAKEFNLDQKKTKMLEVYWASLNDEVSSLSLPPAHQPHASPSALFVPLPFSPELQS